MHAVSWSFKDASTYQDPSVLVSVRNAKGDTIEAAQETPVAVTKTPSELIFVVTVHIQTPLSELPKQSAVFLEMKHYKSAKKKVSVGGSDGQ